MPHPDLVASLMTRIYISFSPVPPPPRQHLHSTQDLLKRFQLLPAYDKYVRPSAVSGSDVGFDGADPITPAPVTPGGVDKGKGREVSGSGGVAVDHSHEDTGLGDGDGDDDDGPGGKGEKKKKNSYKHLIKGVPGAFFRCGMRCLVFYSSK